MDNFYEEINKRDNIVFDRKISFSNRNRLVNKVEREISKVKFNDTKKLIGIAKTISLYQLENAQIGKALTTNSLEEFISKVVMNDNNILSGTDISYYSSVAENNKKCLQSQKTISYENEKAL